MGDIVGRLFREFAITLAISILVSAVVSLTLTPMMCARLLRHVPEERESRLARASEHLFNVWIERYSVSLRWVLQHQTLTLLVFMAALAATVVLYVIVPKGFFPVQDTGVIVGISEVPATASFDALVERQQALAALILRDPAVESLTSFIGVDGVNLTPNSGRTQINLKPLDVRRIDASAIIRRLQGSLATVAGITLYMQPVQDLTVEDRVSRTQYQFSLEHPDQGQLSAWSDRLLAALRTRPELTDVASDQQNGGLRAMVVIDRDAAARFGVTAQQIDDALYSAFGQRLVSTILTQLNQYHVVMEVRPEYQQSPVALNDVYVPTVTGTNAPLTTMAHVNEVSSAARDQPSGAVSCRHAVVQPGAGGGARPGGSRRRERPRRALRFRPGSRRHSRGPRRPFSPHSRMKAGSCWPRSSPSTSCSACSTRATSTR